MAESRKLGRQAEKPEPETIPDSSEYMLRTLVTAPSRGEDEWNYLKRAADNRPVGDT